MPNKPDKFGIKFCLESYVQSKYLVNGFPYLGKDEIRRSDISLSDILVTKLEEQYLEYKQNIIYLLYVDI